MYLESEEGKREMKRLARKYVLVSADKSENNVIVVCKKYYVKRLRDELLGTDHISSNSSSKGSSSNAKEKTYRKETRSIEEVIEEQIETLREEFGLEVDEKMKKLARPYWTVKMHYDPPRERHIAGSSKCVLKVLSQLISKCLKTIQNEMVNE
jgi:hypothetical protein